MNRITLIEWLAIIRTARQILRQAADLLDLPDPDDPQAVYAWTRAIVTIAAQAAKVTPTPVDDAVTAWLIDGPLATYENFLPVYRIVREIITLVTTNLDDAQLAARVAAKADLAPLASNPVGVDPITVVTIIVKLIRLIMDLAK